MSTTNSNSTSNIWNGSLTNQSTPYYPQQQSIGITSTTIGPTYYLLKLPEPSNVQPEEVFWNGRNLTLGVLGSRAEAAFMGQNLIFDSKVTNALTFCDGYKVIIKYSKAIYHYHIDADPFQPKTKPNTKILDLQLLSTIERL